MKHKLDPDEQTQLNQLSKEELVQIVVEARRKLKELEERIIQLSISLNLDSKTSSDLDLKHLAKDTIFALFLQLSGVVLTYLVQVCLARWMGKVEYGIYTYVVAWCLVLAIPVGLGLPRAVLRFITEYRVKEEWGKMRGLLLSSWQLTLGMGLLVAITCTIIISVFDYYYQFTYAQALIFGVWIIPLQSLLQLQEDMGRGAKSLTIAYGPSKVLWPILLLGGSFCLFQWQEKTLTSIPMIDMTIATLVGVVLLQLAFIWQSFAQEITSASTIYARRQWLGVALPLLFHRAFREILRQIDIIMVGSFLGVATAGIYNAAANTALWVSFILQTVNLVVAPTFTHLYTQKDRIGLQKVVLAASIWIFWPSLIIAGVLIIFAQPILALFGEEFVTANWSLKILVIGQLTNALCGSVGNLMVMTGYQNQVLIVSGSCALINVVLNAIAIPILGMDGAALATAFTLIVYNVWCSFLVVKNIKIFPSIISSFFHRDILTINENLKDNN
ncbi:flippase [Limnofasciculus baicalensis]|nr:flippase [Limnofasciculus baicalensis]